jgi:Taurine catabolism dioxygenase TauD, TfdA family
MGPIVKVVLRADFDMNSTLTCEAMPMHYDGKCYFNNSIEVFTKSASIGIFKVKTLPNGEITNDPPLLQMFQCVHAPGGGEGRTMIANGAEVLNSGLTPAQRDWLRERSSISFTPKNEAFGGNPFKMPLVIHNEHSGHDVIRWLESW